MAINETIVIGRKFRKCIDPVNKIWQRFSLWTKSPDVEFEDGKDAETKLGMINGITSDLNCEDESIAISASAVRDLSAKIDNKDTFIVPNYGSIKSVGNNFTVPAKGWIYMRSQHDVVSTENKSTILLINGIKIWETSVGVSNQVTHWEIASSGLYPVKQNDIIRYSVSHMVATLYFISAESIN